MPRHDRRLGLSYWTGAAGMSMVRFDNIALRQLIQPKVPVIFIPGIGGSQLKANQDIIWSADDGHGGTYSHAYQSNENLWVNQIYSHLRVFDILLEIIGYQGRGFTDT